MSIPRSPDPAKLIIGFFLKEKSLLDPVVAMLADKFGPVDMVGPWFSFDYTDYYEPEMGTPLFRRMLSFKTLIRQGRLAEIKHETNGIEEKFTVNGRRRVNIDPGYMLLSQFVLATGKNYSHRIYIGKGIYADLTLIYGGGEFKPLPWTYPDYADEPMRTYLHLVRKKVVRDIKNYQETLKS